MFILKTWCGVVLALGLNLCTDASASAFCQQPDSRPVLIFVTPSKTTVNTGVLGLKYLNPDASRFWTRDSHEGITYDPITLHKYIFANGNPVNHFDRSGNDVDYLDFLLDGIIVHASIGKDFVGVSQRRLANYYPISGIINRAEGRDDNSDDYLRTVDGEFLPTKPDLVDLDTRKVWEIKTTRGYAQGVAENLFYISVLNEFSRPGSKLWSTGADSDYQPPSTAKGFLRTAKVYGANNGVITYDPYVSNEAIVGTAAGVIGAEVVSRLASRAAFTALADIYATIVTASLEEAY